MFSGEVHDPRSENRRRHRRVRLAVPIRLGKGAVGAGERRDDPTGLSRDLGTGGVYLTTSEPGPFVPGEVLKVSMCIPWEMRRRFPFSRIAGLCRVVRVEQVPISQEILTGLALAFCGDHMTMLGAVVATR